MRGCIYRKQLDLETLVSTRGPNFVIAAGVAADVPSLWKSSGDGRVRTADQRAGPWRNVVAPDRTIVQTA